MSRTRTFVAVDVSDGVRSRAARLITHLRSEIKVSWVAPANMHITLKFLGDQTDEAVAAICRAVQEGAAAVDPFEFTCQGAGAFPDIRRPRTLWVGVTEGLEEFRQLHAVPAASDDRAGAGRRASGAVARRGAQRLPGFRRRFDRGGRSHRLRQRTGSVGPDLRSAGPSAAGGLNAPTWQGSPGRAGPGRAVLRGWRVALYHPRAG